MIHVKDIKKLYQVFQNDDIDKIEIRNGDEKLSFTISSAPLTKKAQLKAASQAMEAAAQAAAAAVETPVVEDKPQSNVYELRSKWIGFFIRLNPKTAENYVKLRDVVKKGETIEARFALSLRLPSNSTDRDVTPPSSTALGILAWRVFFLRAPSNIGRGRSYVYVSIMFP